MPKGGLAPPPWASGGGQAKAAAPQTPRDPEKDLIRQVARLAPAARTNGSWSGDAIRNSLTDSLKGLNDNRVSQLASDAGLDGQTTQYIRSLALKSKVSGMLGRGALGAVEDAGGAVAGEVLKDVQRPAQAILSGVGEWSRQAEKDPVTRVFGVPIGHFNVRNLGDIGARTSEGFQLKRHDSPSSIGEEAAKTREQQGRSPGMFGIKDKWADPRTWPSGVKVAFDVAGTAAVDPLTYLTLGVGAAAKAGIKTVEATFDAATAARVAREGISALSEAERARLTPEVLDALKGARGGIGVKLPQPIEALKGDKILAPSRTLIDTGPLTRPLGKVLNAAADTKLGSKLEQVFRPRAEMHQAVRGGEYGADVPNRLYEENIVRGAQQNRGVREMSNEFNYAAKEAKATPADVELIARAHDAGSAGRASLEPRLQPLWDTYDDITKRLLETDIRQGRLSSFDDMAARLPKPDPQLQLSGLEDPVPSVRALNPEQYRVRIPTEEGQKFFNRPNGPTLEQGLGYDPNPLTAREGSYTHGRTFERDLPLHEINAKYAEQAGGPIFHENAVMGLSHRIIQGNKDAANYDFVQRLGQVKDANGTPILRKASEFKDVATGKVRIPNSYEKVTVPGVGEVVVHRSIKNEIRRMGIISEDSSMKALLSLIDKPIGLWKSYATIPFPFSGGFSLRNAYGNYSLNWLADIAPTDPAYVQSLSMWRQARRGWKEGDPLKYLGGESRKIYDEAVNRGIVDEGFFRTEMTPLDAQRAHVSFGQASMKDKLGRVGHRVNPLDPQFAPLAAGRDINSFIEDHARLSHFISKYHTTHNFDAAAQSVRKYLFDYGDLTGAENAIRRFIPFYTFTRKNLPIQIEHLIKNPGKQAAYQHLREAIAAQADPTEGPYPSFLAGQGGIPLPQSWTDNLSKIPGLGFQKGVQSVAAPDLPIFNAAETVQPFLNLAAEVPGLNKLGLPRNEEGVAGAFRDLMPQFGPWGAPVQAALGREAFTGRQFYPGERVDAPIYLKGGPWNPLSLLAQNRSITKGGPQVSSITRLSQFLAEQAFPILNKVRGTFPTSAADADKAARRRLSMVTGLGVYPLGAATQKAEVQRRLASLQRTQQDLERQGFQPANLPSSPRKGSTGSKLKPPPW